MGIILFYFVGLVVTCVLFAKGLAPGPFWKVKVFEDPMASQAATFYVAFWFIGIPVLVIKHLRGDHD